MWRWATAVTNMLLGYFHILKIKDSQVIFVRLWDAEENMGVKKEIGCGGYRTSPKVWCLASIHFLHTCDLLHS